jgi:hypothetical protein
MPRHKFILTTDTGAQLADLGKYTDQAMFARVTGERAPFRMVLKPTIPWDWVKADNMVQFWRAPAGGRLSLWRTYFIRRRRAQTFNGEKTVVIGGFDVNDLLRRRVVAAYAGSSNAKFTATEADDGMKDITADMILDSIEPTPDAGTRVWANFTVQGDQTDGPALTKSYSFQKVDQLLLNIREASRAAGTEVFFDVVESDIQNVPITLQFQTKTGQPGQDVSENVVFSEDRGNLMNPFYEEDYSDLQNYIYSGGQKQGTRREFQQVYDEDSYNLSEWNRCEGYVNASYEEEPNAVREAGRARLEERRARIRAGGRPQDTRGTRFGRDWNWGDRVTMKHFGLEFDVVIRAMSIWIDDTGREHKDARLEWVA